MSWVLYILLILVSLAGALANLALVPGLWVIVLAAIIYAAATRMQFFGVTGLCVLTGLALLGELLEFLISGVAARRAGAGKAGMVGAIVGALLGSLILSFVVPIFPVGTLLGVLLGAFLGAAAGELVVGAELIAAVRVGAGAAKGRLLAILAKLAIGLVMTCVVLFAMPIHRSSAAPTPPAAPITPTTSQQSL